MEISLKQQEITPNNDWTEGLCLQLIEFYRISPELWDHKHSHHFKKEKKNEAWRAIGQALGKSPQACKHKMSVLFSSFRREKAKIMQSIRNNAGTGTSSYASNWFGFKALSFLLIKDKLPRPVTRQKIQYKKKKDREDVTEEALVVKQGEMCNEVQSTSTSTQNRDSAAADTDDEIKSFISFVAIKMKKYSEGTNSAVQQAICNILFQADQGHFETSRSTISSTSMMSPRVEIQPKDKVHALIVKEEDLESE